MKTLKKFLVPLLVLAILASFAVVPTSAAPANPDIVIYLGTNTATGDGTSAASPLAAGTATTKTFQNAPLYQAWDKIIRGSYTNAVIVFTDEYVIEQAHGAVTSGDAEVVYTYNGSSYAWTFANKTITYTSVYGGVDYRATNGAKIRFDGATCLNMPTATVTENITIQGSTQADGRDNYISAGGRSMTLGQGTNFLKDGNNNYPTVLGVFRYRGFYDGSATRYDTTTSNITVDVGEGNNVGPIYGGWGVAADAVGHQAETFINIKSGNVNGLICGDNVSGGLATTGKIHINISGGNINNGVALVSTGYAASNTETGTITVTGGTFNTNYSIYNRKGGDTATNAGAATFVIDCTNCDNEVYLAVKTCAGRQGLSGYVTAPSPFQNTTTGTRYKTIAEACAAANSGETIQMYASATETNVVIPKGVALDVNGNTLTANAVIGLAGSGIYGSTASSKIVVPQGNLILDETIYTNDAGNSFLPYWDATNSCYKLSTVGLNTDGFGMTISETEISFKFEHALAQSARDVIGTAAADNGVKVAVQLRWMVGNNEAVQNFYFSDADFAVVEGGGNYTFSLTNYAELGIDGATVEIQPMVETDTGVVFYGETWVNGAIAQ